jgi:hypothetical protein
VVSLSALACHRYVTACCLHAQLWVAPGLTFMLAVALTYVNGGNPLTTLAEGATWLFPVTGWITVATVNGEDPSQAAITATATGGVTRTRAVKLAVGATACSALAALSLAAAYATNASSFTLGDLAAGAFAHLLAIIGGVALGSLCARPLISHTGWAVLIISLVTVTDLIVPGAPPARLTLDALDALDIGRMWEVLVQAATEVVALAVVLIGVSIRLSRNRS